LNLNHFQKFLALKKAEKQLFFEALWWQYYTRFLLIFIPFRRILKHFSGPEPGRDLPRAKSRGESPLETLENIKTATARANLLALWKNRCLVQSLAARRMLSRRGIASTLHFGMTAVQHQNPTAHAWLTVGDFEVVNKGTVEVEFLGESK
jgi:hypothetical protein